MKKQQPQSMQLAAIYARYSSSAQNDDSIEQQVEACRAYAADNGLNVVEVFADHAISGRSDRRPQYQRMIRAAENGAFRVLIAYKSNRIARNMLNALACEDKLDKLGVKVVYCKESFGDDAAGRFAARTMMNLNQFFSENLAEDVRRGMLDNAKKCRVNGKPPYGYTVAPDGTFAIHPEHAKVVQEIYRRIDDGSTYAALIDDLNARHIHCSTGGAWHQSSVRRIVSNERYTGVYIYADVRIEGGIPRIIEPELFQSVQRKVDILATNVKARRRRENVDYVLTGKLFCGHCRQPMVGTCGTSKTGAMYYYYRCDRNSVEHTCPKKPVRKERIEQLVVDAVYDIILKPDMIDYMADGCMQLLREAQDNSNIDSLRAQRRKAHASMANLLKVIESGVISPTVSGRITELEKEIEYLEAEIHKAESFIPKFDREEVVFYLESLRTKSRNRYNPKVIADVVHTFVRAVYLYDDHFDLFFSPPGSSTSDSRSFPLTTPSHSSADVLINGTWEYHYVTIRTPARIGRVGQVFFLSAYYEFHR